MTMRYRILGGTGIQVSPYCLGTMMFGGAGNRDHDDCTRIIHAALGQAESGCSLPQLAVAFTMAHPAVTSVIIGPRTMPQLTHLLEGASLALRDEVLDRIDEIVPPGVNLYRPDDAWRPPALAEPVLRRRPLAERAAA